MRATKDADKASYDAKIKALEKKIATQKDLQANHTKRANRLKEEGDNAARVSELAERLTNTRTSSDSIRADLSK